MAVVKELKKALEQKPELADKLDIDSHVDFDVAPWPDDLAQEAFHGLAGEVVRAIDPYSEADPAGLLTNFLVAFGNVIGRGPHFRAGADRHYLNLFAALVGETSKGRKGMSWSWARELFRIIDQDWIQFKTPGGLSTGEGLIWSVRDPIIQRQPINEKGRGVTGYEEVEIDSGVNDKRLLVLEPEFSSALKVSSRQGNTLSALIRRAWDTGDLSSMTKNSPARATGAHISIIGHITRMELIQTLAQLDQANGFANRFLWVCVRRSKCLPDGATMPQQELNRLAGLVNEAVQFAKGVGEMRRDGEAAELWRLVYPVLSDGKPGLVGAVTGRAEAQVMRLACIYALLDLSSFIRVEHLKAALAFWDRCESSAQFIFGDNPGDPVAQRILEALEEGPKTQTEISELFERNLSANLLKEALQRLSAQGLITARQQKTGRRPITFWSLGKA